LGGGWAAENEHAVRGVADARVLGTVEDVPSTIESVELRSPDTLGILLLMDQKM